MRDIPGEMGFNCQNNYYNTKIHVIFKGYLKMRLIFTTLIKIMLKGFLLNKSG